MENAGTKNSHYGIDELFEHYPYIFAYFIVGYYVLFVVYSTDFLKYDILTKIILALIASLLIDFSCTLIPDKIVKKSLGLQKLKSEENENLSKNAWIVHSASVLIIFTLINYFDIEIIIRDDAINFLPFLIIIFIINLAYEYKTNKK